MGMTDFGGLPTHLPNTTPAIIPIQNEEVKEIVSSDLPAQSAVTDSEENGNSTISSASMCIPGTSIKLETDEDIAKWIEDRKRNWPTKRNIEERKSRQPPTAPEASTPANKKPRNLCRYFQQHGRCRFGKNCKNVHENAGDTGRSAALLPNVKTINNFSVSIPQRFKNNSTQPSLFKKLVQKDHYENENEEVLDFIMYLQRQNCIEPVGSNSRT